MVRAHLLFTELFAMSHADLAKTIDDAFEARAEIRFDTKGEVRDAVEQALALLDKGEARVAEKIDGQWQVNQWLKKAVLLNFRLNDNRLIEGAPGGSSYWDKVPTKFEGWGEAEFRQACGTIARLGQLTTPSHNEVVLAAGSLGISALVCLLNNGDGGQRETTANLMGPFWRKGSPVTPNGGSIVRSPTPGRPGPTRTVTTEC